MSLSMHSKRYFRCLAGAMTDCLAKRLGVLLAASVGMLLFAGWSLALVPDQRDHERSTRYCELFPGGVDIRASVPAESAGGMGTIGSAAAFLDQPWIDWLDSAADRDRSNDDEDGDCCGMSCGVTCHAAIGDVGNDTCARRPPSSAGVPTGSPSLLSRSQDPPERPPRAV